MNVSRYALLAGLIVAGVVPGTASAGDLLTRGEYIDYQAQLICTQKMYNYPDAASLEREMSRVDRAFGISAADNASGRVNAMIAKYGADESTDAAIDARAHEICPAAL